MENLALVTNVVWRFLGALGWITIIILVLLVDSLLEKLLNKLLKKRFSWTGYLVALLIAFGIMAIITRFVFNPIAQAKATMEFAENIAIFYFEQCDKMGAIGVWASIIGGILAPLVTAAVFVIKQIVKKRQVRKASS